MVMRNGKIVWKHVLLYFRLNLKYQGGRTEHTSKQWKMMTFVRNCLMKMTLTALATSCCYGLGVMPSKTVQEITADQKEYRKCPLRVIICWIAKIYQSINNSEKWLVTRIPLTQLKKLLKLHRKTSNNWPVVSVINNGSEIRTWISIASKPKKKSRVTYLR